MIKRTKSFDRFAWIARSRKAHVAIGSLVIVMLSKLLPAIGFTPGEVESVVNVVKIVASTWIAGIAIEDGLRGGPPPAN